MADARSVIPMVFTWPIKKFITSYNAIPRKPGKEVNLLLSIKILAGAELVIQVSILLKKGISFVIAFLPCWMNPFSLLIPAGKVLHIYYDQ